MNQAVRVVFDSLREVAWDDFGGSYVLAGSVFAHPPRLLIMQNFTDQDALISFDGVTTHMFLPEGGQVVLDFASNASSVAGMWSMSVGEGVYVQDNGTPPTTGSVFASVAYGKGE